MVYLEQIKMLVFFFYFVENINVYYFYYCILMFKN